MKLSLLFIFFYVYFALKGFHLQNLFLFTMANVKYCMAASENISPGFISVYGKCSKTSNTNVSDKMTYANSADPDQTAPSGAV